jgi:8-oxo-dGTP pyrophosphatase MutT (NUDIX family)
VKFGEEPRECVVREFMEETGLVVLVMGVLDVVADVTDMVTEPVRLHSIRVIYEVEVLPSLAVAEVDGSTDAVLWAACKRLSDFSLIPWLEDFANAHLVPR